MSITNLMKDIVINTVEEVLKEKENVNIPKNGKDDIIAYVLNRIQPKYATSERGLLHGVLDAKYMIQQRVDVFFLIYEAIHMINRRGSSHETEWASSESSYFLPHIVGQVLEESSLSVVSDVEVSLLYKGAATAMVDSFWDNPYKTNEATKGHYHFWPQFSERSMARKSTLSFTLGFHHAEFADKTIDIDIAVDLKSKRVQTQFVPLVLLS